MPFGTMSGSEYEVCPFSEFRALPLGHGSYWTSKVTLRALVLHLSVHLVSCLVYLLHEFRPVVVRPCYSAPNEGRGRWPEWMYSIQ